MALAFVTSRTPMGETLCGSSEIGGLVAWARITDGNGYGARIFLAARQDLSSLCDRVSPTAAQAVSLVSKASKSSRWSLITW